MNTSTQKHLNQFKLSRILLPIIIGLVVAVYLIYKEKDQIATFSFTTQGLFFLLGAVGLMLFRDFGYILRLRTLSGKSLTWIQCIKVVFLWEFASAITPTAIGGTGVAVFFLHQEKLSWAESTTIVMATSFLDELFFAISFPILLLSIGWQNLFIQYNANSFVNNLIWFAIAGYAIKLCYIIFVSYALFFRPLLFKKIIVAIASLPFLRRWKEDAAQYGDEFVVASETLQHKPIFFWIKSFFATTTSWISRYWTANLIILGVAVSTVNPNPQLFEISNQMIIFARQLIMWIMMMVMPSPGGAGFSEFLFSQYMTDFIPHGYGNMVSLIWRAISYYPYLLIGAIIFPIWVRNNFTRKK
ncbi:flippase-like domain-containing protein [Halosquirtibacter xylanolyticus]|uniref:lysylphosphatidylglycerol synthase transmembrane domain-containing protein n=1 Tax=Halosquirtibacter xylanolyticus TaxID=3374599 RepID=UPI0037489011|nr:flippase-like domain-containing protein [Prolixibacteraceae bacterium]